MSKYIKLLVNDISWDVPEELLDLEPLSEDAPLGDHIKRMFQEIPERVKEPILRGYCHLYDAGAVCDDLNGCTEYPD